MKIKNLINENELKEKFDPHGTYDYASIMRKIETTRVERSVVLCKNCQFSRNNVTGDPDDWYCEKSWRGRVHVDENDFCSWGKGVDE